MAEGWGWWSEVKLQILKQYLEGFTTAVTGRSSEVICLDLFAGSYENWRRNDVGTFPGSAQLALATKPPFTRLAFFELTDEAAKLRSDIERAHPGDERWSVLAGDCNVTLPIALRRLEPYRWAPTFAFLDPRGLQVAWNTVARLAAWRADKKTKVEQWILLPEPALARVLGLQGAQGRRSAQRLDELFGTRDWIAIHQLRREGSISALEMRAEFVNLLRWRLETVLGYKTTHALQIINTAGHPVYTMVFATDSEAGDRIMSHVYDSAATSTIPTMQMMAQKARRRRRESESGVVKLPGFEDFGEPLPAKTGKYDHVSPWEPPLPTDALLDLEGQTDIDPDEIDIAAWEREISD
ncbi:MAG: three-Cys-motif partner protein TcmP [Acidimicrobiales bacterium]